MENEEEHSSLEKSRRSMVRSLIAGAIATIGLGGAKVQAQTRARPPRGRELSPDQALEMMKNEGIINRDVTWEKMEEVSKKLGSGNGSPGVYRWSFIDKDKFIYRDIR